MKNFVHNQNYIRTGFICLSLLLLFCFLVYWNVDTYHRKKADLVKDLRVQAQLASSEVNDSLLYTIIQVMRLDSGETEVTKTLRKVTKGVQLRFEEELHSGTNNDSMFMSIIDGGIHLDTEADTLNSFVYFSDDSCSLNQSHMQINFTSKERPDTNLAAFMVDDQSMGESVLIGFKEKLTDQNLPTSFELIENGEGASNDGAIVIDFDFDRFSKVKSEVVFTGYEGFLLRKMWPSIFMSLGLFLFIFGAFYLAYQAWKEQEKLNQIKNEFVSNMTHELKTPITTVGVALEALSDFNALSNPEKTKDYIDISKHELARLNILVDKVLKMSMFEKGKSILKIEEINIKNILDEILSSMKLHFEQKNVQVDYQISGTNFNMEGDKVHLTNVCYNLIDNAIKYSPENPRLKLLLGNHPEKISISVIDHGIGIPKAYIGKVFHRFFRVPTNDIHNVKGHGLGLSYVHQIIEKHKGTITVQSEEGKGSTFYIELPRKIIDA